jgi:hypothetical protein
MPEVASASKQAIARMRSSVVSINDGDPGGPIGSGVIVRGGKQDDAIIATALHFMRDVAPVTLQVGFLFRRANSFAAD